MIREFINGMGDILVDLGKISFGGIVIGSIMGDKGENLNFIIIGSAISSAAFVLGLILKITTTKKRGNYGWS